MKQRLEQIINFALSTTIGLGLATLFSEVGAICVAIFGPFRSLFDLHVAHSQASELSKQLQILTLSNVALLALLVLLFRHFTKFKSRFGILWNKRNKPICPKCRQPLQLINVSSDVGSLSVFPEELRCASCSSAEILFGDNGFFIPFADALKLL